MNNYVCPNCNARFKNESFAGRLLLSSAAACKRQGSLMDRLACMGAWFFIGYLGDKLIEKYVTPTCPECETILKALI